MIHRAGAEVGAAVGAVAGRRQQTKAQKSAEEQAEQATAKAEVSAENESLKKAMTVCLEAKGYNLAGESNFLDHEGEYDRIVMNPPFEAGQDIDHVRHAFQFLKDGGRLVSIMSPSPFFREDKKGGK